MDGVLYSRGKYIILFDPGDFYEDNYVLEDAYNINEKYKLDSSAEFFGHIPYYRHNMTFSRELVHLEKRNLYIIESKKL